MTYEHIVQCAKCGAFGQFERGHQCEPVSCALAIVPDTLQHIGGGWECFIDTVEVDTFRATIGSWPFQICTTAASYWWCASKEWLAYHADREGKAECTD